MKKESYVGCISVIN